MAISLNESETGDKGGFFEVSTFINWNTTKHSEAWLSTRVEN